MKKKSNYTTQYGEEVIATITPPSQTRTENEEERVSSMLGICIESKLEEAERELKKAKKDLRGTRKKLEVIKEISAVRSVYAPDYPPMHESKLYALGIRTISRMMEKSIQLLKKFARTHESPDPHKLLRYHDPQYPLQYQEFDAYTDAEAREIAWLILAKETNQNRIEEASILKRIYQNENLVLRPGETKTRETLLEEALKSQREAYKNWDKKWEEYLKNKDITGEQAYQKIPEKLRDREISS